MIVCRPISLIVLSTTIVLAASQLLENSVVTVTTLGEFADVAGSAGQVVIVSGREWPDYGGSGTFFWPDDPEIEENGGTVVTNKTRGVWGRLFSGALHASWFGVMPTATDQVPNMDTIAESTMRFHRALAATAGGRVQSAQGIYYVSRTLIVPGNTLVEGMGPHNVYSGPAGGTSDIEITSCRRDGKATAMVRPCDDGAYYSYASLMNAHDGGQGHRFVGCSLRTNTKYMMKLPATHRDLFFGCYFEATSLFRVVDGKRIEQRPFMENARERTDWVRFVDSTTWIARKKWNDGQTSCWPTNER